MIITTILSILAALFLIGLLLPVLLGGSVIFALFGDVIILVVAIILIRKLFKKKK